MVSPELTFSTGGCALLNQPHCVVSIVAGRRWTFPGYFFAGTSRSFSCSGVDAGTKGTIAGAVAGGAVAGAGAGGCACCAPATEHTKVKIEATKAAPKTRCGSE